MSRSMKRRTSTEASWRLWSARRLPLGGRVPGEDRKVLVGAGAETARRPWGSPERGGSMKPSRSTAQEGALAWESLDARSGGISRGFERKLEASEVSGGARGPSPKTPLWVRTRKPDLPCTARRPLR